MAVQFEAGYDDAALRLSAQDFVRLRGDPKYQAVVMESGTGYVYVAADVTRAPLDKKEVRQAINSPSTAPALIRRRWTGRSSGGPRRCPGRPFAGLRRGPGH